MPVSVTPSAKPPQNVPSMDEFNALAERVDLLEVEVGTLDQRVDALEAVEPEPPDPPDPEPEPEPGNLCCFLTLNGTRFEFNEADGHDLGDYHDPARRFVMSCKRVILPTCPITVDFRHAGVWSCMIFAYGDPNDTTSADCPAYTVEIPEDVSLQFKVSRRRGKTHRRLASINLRLDETISLSRHNKFGRWRWQSCEWPFPLTSIFELVEQNLLPRLDAAVSCGTAGPMAPVYYEPMGLAGIYPTMGAGGARPDIGFVTNWQADYICTESETALDNVIAQGEAAGTVPWYLRDPGDAAIIDPTSTKWKSASFYYGSGAPQLIQGAGSGVQIDSAHEPAVSYLPFVLTGDPYYLESLQSQVVYFITSQPGGWYNQGNGIWKPLGMGQTRGVAWITRDVMQAAKVTPDNVPSWLLPKTKMREIFQASIDGFNNIRAATEPLRSVFHAVSGSRGDYDNVGPGGTIPGGCWYITWQEDFVACVVNWGVMMHPDIHDLRAFAEWHINGLIDRIDPNDNSGWCDGWCELYWTAFQDTTAGPQYDTWVKAWERNSYVQGLPVRTLDVMLNDAAAYDYPNGCQAGLAMACQAGVTQAIPALNKIKAAMDAGLTARKGSKEFKWCVA